MLRTSDAVEAHEKKFLPEIVTEAVMSALNAASQKENFVRPEDIYVHCGKIDKTGGSVMSNGKKYPVDVYVSVSAPTTLERLQEQKNIEQKIARRTKTGIIAKNKEHDADIDARRKITTTTQPPQVECRLKICVRTAFSEVSSFVL